ncbi:hypothetical protein [Rhodopirellula bahusiensis]|uniref:hypothetical protein n=1 Tax=Rhodopirellula bahusiensis TaxID=2014065 RepID=UPI003266FE4E
MASTGMTDGGSDVEQTSSSKLHRALVNPYATSMRLDGTDPNPATNSDQVGIYLAFDGEITSDDIRRLIPQRELGFLLAVLMWGFLIPAFVIGGTVVSINAVRIGFDSETFTKLVCCFGVASGFALATQYVSPGRRMRRALKQRPDLVGRAVGRFVANGLLFNDGERTHYLNADYCRRAELNRHGVKVPLLEGGPYVQLYLAKRLFDRFESSVWKQLESVWREHDASQLDLDAVMESNCKQLGVRPDSAVTFEGQVTLQMPVDHGAVRGIMYRNGGLVVTYGVGMSVAWHFGFTVLAVGSLLLMLGTLRYFYNSWRWMAVPSQEFSWRQRGWISEDEVVSVNETNGIRLFRSEYLRTEWIDEKLVWHLGNNRAMYFSREHFESDGDWNWICETSSLESASE